MTKKIIIILLLLSAGTVAFLLNGCYYDNEQDLYQFVNEPCDTSAVKYSTTISPIMQKNCNSCHTTQAPSANVITENYNGLKVIASDKRLERTVNHEQGVSAMPKGGNKLSACDLAKIRIWVAAGAPNN